MILRWHLPCDLTGYLEVSFMDQNKNTQGQGQGQQGQGQQNQGQGQQNQNRNPQPTQGSPEQSNRDQAEGSRDQSRGGSNTNQPSGKGQQGERNRGGISNRDMDEQSDLPDRGSSQSDR